jgi:hypothetical protein
MLKISTLSEAGHVYCCKHFVRPEILLPVRVLYFFWTSLSGCALLNASQTAANDSDMK